MANEQSRLFWDWVNEKGNIEAFLSDPLEWVAGELEKACEALPFDRPLRRGDVDTIKTLVSIIRFVDEHRNLLPIK